MIRSIHCSRLLERQLAALRKSGKKGEIAATQFERILACLKFCGAKSEDIYIKRTKNGEYRLRNCVKYDLGCGYRVITVRIRDRLYVPFLGVHDAANLWLERHGQDGFVPQESFYSEEILVSPEQCIGDVQQDISQLREENDIYEEQLLARLDESILKDIFQGLYRKQSDSLDRRTYITEKRTE